MTLAGLFVRALPVIAGLLIPAYATVSSIESPGTADDTQYLIYWLLYSLVVLVEALLWSVLKWLGPTYHLIKAAALLWLVMPQTKGATFVYEDILSPVFKQLGTQARSIPAIKAGLEKVDELVLGKKPVLAAKVQ